MTVLVTGAGGAIGSAIVRQLAEAGREVVAQDLTAEALATATDWAAESIVGDLTTEADLRTLQERFAGESLHAVVAAHGIPGAGALAHMNRERIDAILAVNAVTIPALLRATLAPLAADGGGAFVAIASQAALRGEPDNAVYCASKWAVTGWVSAIAPHLALDGVRVRALCPGRTEGPLLERALEGFAAEAGQTVEEYVADILKLIPLGRYARVEETAAAAVYLAETTATRPTILATSGGEVPF